jgi:hypothetical protein
MIPPGYLIIEPENLLRHRGVKSISRPLLICYPALPYLASPRPALPCPDWFGPGALIITQIRARELGIGNWESLSTSLSQIQLLVNQSDSLIT